jgi:hypothetical protein
VQLISVIENKIIQRLEVLNPSEYDSLFKILNIFRYFDIGSEHNKKEELDFYQIVENNLIKNLKDIPPSSVVQMAVHYANNAKEQQDHKI